MGNEVRFIGRSDAGSYHGMGSSKNTHRKNAQRIYNKQINVIKSTKLSGHICRKPEENTGDGEECQRVLCKDL